MTSVVPFFVRLLVIKWYFLLFFDIKKYHLLTFAPDNRLVEKYPNLSKTELRTCDQLYRKVNKKAHDLIRKNPIKTDNGFEFMDFISFQNIIQTDYEWIDNSNFNKRYSQSCYYALK